MADKKKDEGGGRKIHPAEPVIYALLIGAILSAIFMRVDRFLASREGLSAFLSTLWQFIQGNASFDELVGATGSPGVFTLIFVFRVISLALCVLLIFGIIYTYRRFIEVKKKLYAPIKPPKEISYDIQAPVQQYVNPKWSKVLEHINSPNPADWRLAILEADIILNDMLDKMGYAGSTLGDRLKSVEASDFDTLQEAWEAHKVRNAIAHEGSDLALTKPEAERVIKLFEKVFKEFKYI